MRIALGIEYDGTDFLGWQRLSHGRTLQGEVEAALSFVADHPLDVTCAGRTDAGVHARCQVVHFDSVATRSERAWTLGANSRLPPDIAVLWAREVDESFHARFGAHARRYRYVLLNRPIRAALDARFMAWEGVPLDAQRMHAAAQAVLGENDFSAFRTAQCQARTPMRNVHSISVTRLRELVSIEVQANAFLHHMVRNLVGSLLMIGRGERPIEWMAELLQGRDRKLAGPTASASGLSFLGPRYAAHWNLPEQESA